MHCKKRETKWKTKKQGPTNKKIKLGGAFVHCEESAKNAGKCVLCLMINNVDEELKQTMLKKQ